MIYTIGFEAAYRYGIQTQGAKFTKMGAVNGYLGGSVWRTAKEAQDYLKSNLPRLKNYAVYEVEADWKTDVAMISGEPFGRLQVTSRITREMPCL